MTSLPSTADSSDRSHPSDGFLKLAVGAVGVVFGDIGTSPLYAMKESFIGPHPLVLDEMHIYGVLSLIFWTMTLVVTLKYVAIVLRADNRGEGGSLALLALVSRGLGGQRSTALLVLGVLATALFYGDAIITPAISVLSAVEGLTVVEARLEPLVLPLALIILVGLFLIQARGTARVGSVFGPIVLVYFATLAILGVANMVHHPEILGILNPLWAVRFFALDPALAFLALGSVVLAVTGAEALYADMGHFGRRPIALSWLTLVWPCLMLNYMGQGALLLDQPEAISNPFYLMAPDWARLPLVLIATLATVIASQAVISGAFSVTHQAVQLGLLPRIRTLHTSESAAGQIYIPSVNWILMGLVGLLVLAFQESTRLASAYGIAVTGTMFITTCLLGILAITIWRWNRWLVASVIGPFLLVDGAYLASNLTKIPDGGWFPLLVGAVVFTILTTWSAGRRLLQERLAEGSTPLEVVVRSAGRSAIRVPGTAVFMTSNPVAVPPALLHNLKHNRVLHDRNVLLTVVVEEIPRVAPLRRAETVQLGDGFWRVILHYGFMEEVDVPAALAEVSTCGAPFRVMETSFFLGRQTLIASDRPGMAIWREKLFALMVRNAASAMEFFRLPTNRVVELGSQVEI
ncbi:potassium transporter Kup [Rubellimicrobium arenae]|uniref:potassium transporter Kup n=1 Tax=Rubellimicrobium arenae TaxID=2817372 RepID=UPI001B300D19|nr:potassium transporter Kup [Rubellimicrobium arenae]